MRDLCGGEFPGPPAQRRAGGRHRHGQDAPGHRGRPVVHPTGHGPGSTTVVDLVNRLEPRREPAGRAASPTTSPGSTWWCWTSSATCRSRSRASAAVPPDQRLYETTSIVVTTNLRSGVAERVCRRRQDDDGAARSADPPLRDRRNRQRELALQEPGGRAACTQLILDPCSARCATPTRFAGLSRGVALRATRGPDWSPIRVAFRCRLTVDALRGAFQGVSTLFLLNAVVPDEFTPGADCT